MTAGKLIIILILIIVAIMWYRYKREEYFKNKPETVAMGNMILEFFEEIEKLNTFYITKPIRDKFNEKYRIAYEYFNEYPYSKLEIPKLIEFIDAFENFDTFIKEYNEKYIEKELNENKELLDNIDGKSLDEQQRRAVVVDEMNNLVLAGAGSGKTLTISGKVKYLVETKNIKPEEILLISFTRKAADEMTVRISEKLSINVESKTFHKLGLDIIKKYRGQHFDIPKDKFLNNVISSYFDNNLSDNKEEITNIINFFGYYLNIPKDWAEFDSLGECLDYYKNIDFETLKGKCKKTDVDDYIDGLKHNKETIQGEKVKSLEEVIIANYLFLNGIHYIYEYKYPYKSSDMSKKQYRPDFYLPDYDIYIEHFGITKEKSVPWLSPIEEQKYLNGIEWKRQFHKENKTTLLETYSFYNKEGRLLTELERLLIDNNVEFKEIDYMDIFNQAFEKSNNKYFSQFKQLIATFINLFKSNGYSIEYLEELNRQSLSYNNPFLKERTTIFLNIVKPIMIYYQEALNENNLIDFNDMINIATELVMENKTSLDYKYIIIDEYQDISLSRFKLVKEIISKTDAKLMCVGDDWQCIYRFTGSDIELFTNFEKYMGYYELLKIEKTYRNSQELINIAGSFVMKNKRQLTKNLKSDKHNSNPLRIFGYDKDINTAVIKAINEIVANFGESAEIIILGRNNFDIDILNKNENSEFNIEKSEEETKVKYSKYPGLIINYLTAHKSKGLEADNVIVINLENSLLGFPNKISDDPILSLVLTDLDSFEFAEERRLLYVSLTRTKHSEYLIVSDKNKSVFIDELINKFDIKYEFVTKEETINENPKCPKCKEGYLVIRNNTEQNKKFVGCSNYPGCDCTLDGIEVIEEPIKCTSCGGYMLKKKGRYGEFYGCSNHPICKNTLNITLSN
ncbi:UvrD-helicase domain-containing protein [uncultured Clostridium sp.]|uniref:UvrD-helicase domain-containing protein n=1 Tax=uncultured Clostridium sp. TaxID=59620 RepID=UPI0028E655E5|nr:UvrD-helicase domain-containing protein [uncultured Clostridium sp.]